MKKLIATLFFFIPYLASSQMIVYNGSFDSVVLSPFSNQLVPVNWTIVAHSGGESSTDAQAGPYAVRIYNYDTIVKAMLVYGIDDAPNRPGLPLIASPLSIRGYYKYILDNGNTVTDSAVGYIALSRFDQLNGVTDTVAFGTYYFTPTPTYQAFVIPLNYGADSLAPDTMHMRFISSLDGVCNTPSGQCNYLYLDELSLELPSGVIPLYKATPVIYYDNGTNSISFKKPTSDNWSLKLIDVTGRVVVDVKDISTSSFQLPTYINTGVYLYSVTINGRTLTGKVPIY